MTSEPAKQRRAGAALKQLQKAAADLPPAESLSSELFAFATDAVNLLLARAGFPAELRCFIDSLIGASAGELEWFECSDYDLGKRMLGSEAGGKTRQAITKRVQRARTSVTDWQYTNSYIVMESMPGGKDTDGRLHRSKYKLHIMKAALLSVESASEDGYLSERKLKDATKDNLSLIDQTGISRRERFNRPRTDPQAIASKNIKTALTLLTKAAQLIVLAGDDPAHKFAPVLEEVERLCNTLTPGMGNTGEVATISSPAPPSMYMHVHTTTTDRTVDKSVHTPQGAFSGVNVEAGAGIVPENGHPQGASPEKRAAHRDMELFQSVGAETCDITITDEKRVVCDFQEKLEIDRAIGRVADVVDGCNRQMLNLIVRPRIQTQRIELIPLDDIPQEVLLKVSQFAFRCIESSPGNYQAWLAVRDSSYGLAKRLKTFLGADLGANGASRVAGSRNVKPAHIKAYGAAPLVRLVSARPGLIVLESELSDLGAGEAIKTSPPVVAPVRNRPLLHPTSWPAYTLGSLDRSNEDYHFVHRCYEMGWQFWPDEIVNKLMELSDKAQGRGRGIKYARGIVRSALKKHGLQVEFAE